MRAPAFVLLLPILACACRNTGATEGDHDSAATHDTSWIADLSITTGDTVVRLCESGKRYHLTGPALDTVADRYRQANTRKGQWMKVWFMGHIGAITHGGIVDSALVCSKFMHLDASLHCDPIPDPRIAGSYVLPFDDPTHPRSVRIDLFADGWATMYTDLYDMHVPMEEDGRWGTDAEMHVDIHWPMRDQHMTYAWTNGKLASVQQIHGTSVVLERVAASDRMSGAFGRTARWLAAEAAASGRALDATSLTPLTPVRSLFPDSASQQALARSARDTLRLNEQDMLLNWKQVTTVQDIVQLMRNRLRLP